MEDIAIKECHALPYFNGLKLRVKRLSSFSQMDCTVSLFEVEVPFQRGRVSFYLRGRVTILSLDRLQTIKGPSFYCLGSTLFPVRCWLNVFHKGLSLKFFLGWVGRRDQDTYSCAYLSVRRLHIFQECWVSWRHCTTSASHKDITLMGSLSRSIHYW